MRALDTCVLARYLVGDDPDQTVLAEQEVAKGGFVPITVLLELAWLLRSRYQYSRPALADMIADLCRLPAIVVAEEGAMAWVDERLRRGADVADLIHIVAANGCEALVTFDDMRKQVGDNVPLKIEFIG
ncbi:MAG: type II toxin-antitoxin system VapC family toxin [Sphingomonadaceae bacterium]